MTSPAAGQPAVKRHRRVQQPVDRQPLRLEIDAEVAAEEQVGLACFDRDAGRDPAAVEIPGTWLDHVLGDDAAALAAIAARPRSTGSGQPASAARRAAARAWESDRSPRSPAPAPRRSIRPRTPGTSSGQARLAVSWWRGRWRRPIRGVSSPTGGPTGRRFRSSARSISFELKREVLANQIAGPVRHAQERLMCLGDGLFRAVHRTYQRRSKLAGRHPGRATAPRSPARRCTWRVARSSPDRRVTPSGFRSPSVSRVMAAAGVLRRPGGVGTLKPPPRTSTRTLHSPVFRRAWPDTPASARSAWSIEAGQVDRQSVRNQLGEHVEDRRERIAVRPARRDRGMRPPAEDLTDQPGAREPRANFQKEANSVVRKPVR